MKKNVGTMPALSALPDKKLCAWITRHHPTPRQSKDLRSAGYNIRYIPTRERIAGRILAHIEQELAADPDIIVAAHPVQTLHHLAKSAPCPVLIADMSHEQGKAPKWRGNWRQVIRVKIQTVNFIP